MKKILPVLFALPFLAGCPSLSTRSAVEAPRLAHVPAVLKQECRPVVDIPDGPLSTAQTVRLWGRDRQSLGDCRHRHKALAAASEALEGQGSR